MYDGIPHLLSPVVTDPKKAVVALKWTVAEMEERYRKMSKMGVRNIDGYNARVKDAEARGEAFTRTVQTGFDEETGEPVVANLARMPHLLIAGTTGSGKSVAINTMILSLLYKLGPDECRLIMIDPKMLELSVYDGIPHLLSPVVTDPKSRGPLRGLNRLLKKAALA